MWWVLLGGQNLLDRTTDAVACLISQEVHEMLRWLRCMCMKMPLRGTETGCELGCFTGETKATTYKAVGISRDQI